MDTNKIQVPAVACDVILLPFSELIRKLLCVISDQEEFRKNNLPEGNSGSCLHCRVVGRPIFLSRVPRRVDGPCLHERVVGGVGDPRIVWVVAWRKSHSQANRVSRSPHRSLPLSLGGANYPKRHFSHEILAEPVPCIMLMFP